MLRFVIALGIALTVGVNSMTAASAQSYPQRAVKFILPFGPAAGVDITAWLLGEKLAARWGVKVAPSSNERGEPGPDDQHGKRGCLS
jgi:tripartite-type tricarboxylate transporter receptor subunit TctC